MKLQEEMPRKNKNKTKIISIIQISKILMLIKVIYFFNF